MTGAGCMMPEKKTPTAKQFVRNYDTEARRKFWEQLERGISIHRDGTITKVGGGDITIQPGQGGTETDKLPTGEEICHCLDDGSHHSLDKKLPDDFWDWHGERYGKIVHLHNGEAVFKENTMTFQEKMLRDGKVGKPKGINQILPGKYGFVPAMPKPGVSNLMDRVDALEVEGAEVDKELGEVLKLVNTSLESMITRFKIIEERLRQLEEKE